MLEVKDIIKTYLAELKEESFPVAAIEEGNRLFEDLLVLEKTFAKMLRSFPEGRIVYEQFTRMINVEKAHAAKSRLYFRMRESEGKRVNKLIGKPQLRQLHKLPINQRFASFAITSIKDCKSDKATKLRNIYADILTLRTSIINQYLPLAFNRAKVFSMKNKTTAMQFEDMVQVANEALLLAVDKYVPEGKIYKFHHVVKITVLGHLLIHQGAHDSSATLGNQGQKKLYRIRRALELNPDANTKELAVILKMKENEIIDVVSAVKYLSLDQTVFEEEDERLGDRENFIQNEHNQEDFIEDYELKVKVREAAGLLSVLEKKVLALKGVPVYEDAE
jgi:DNA-directed RNA polymerase specialized sigma subunit